MTQFSRLLVLIVFAFAVLAGAEPPRLVVQTTHPRTAGLVALSPNHQVLVTSDPDGLIKLWSVSSGLVLRSIEADMNVLQIAFDPAGRLAVGGEDRVEFYDLATGAKLGALDADPIHATCFDFSSDLVFTGDRRTGVIAWDLSSGKKSKLVANLSGVVKALRVAPGGKTLAALAQDGVLTLFSIPGGKKLGSLNGFAGDANLDFSEDGRLLVGRTTDGKVAVVDVASRKLAGFLPPTHLRDATTFGSGDTVYYRTDDGIGKFSAQSKAATSTAFRAITPSDDFRVIGDRQFGAAARRDQSVELYDLASEKLVQTFRGVTGAVSALASAKGYCVTGTDDGYIHLWDIASGRPIASVHAHDGGVTSVAFSPDAFKLYSVGTDGTLQTWSIPSMTAEPPKSVNERALRQVVVAPKGGRIALVGFVGTLYAGTSTDSLAKIAELGRFGRFAAFSPSGMFLAAASGSQDLLVANLQDGSAPTLLEKAHDSPVNYICFSGDGKHLLTADQGGVVKLWEGSANKPMSTVQLGSSVFCGSVSPDGTTVALGGWTQGVTLIDLNSGQKTGELPIESRNIRAIAYSSDGKYLFT